MKIILTTILFLFSTSSLAQEKGDCFFKNPFLIKIVDENETGLSLKIGHLEKQAYDVTKITNKVKINDFKKALKEQGFKKLDQCPNQF